jgi:signal transduction histidine kinase
VKTGTVERRLDSESFERRLAALTTISGVDPGQDLPSFCADLTRRVAQLVRAKKVEFSIAEDGWMRAQPGTYGFGPEILDFVVPCSAEGSGFADEIVYHGMIFRGGITDDPAFNPYRDALIAMQVSNAIAVGVTAGTMPIGLLAAFDSERESGFDDEDLRMLRIAAGVAGLLWRQKQTSDERARMNEAMRSMVNAMVHELRGPLAVARGYADMLSQETFGELPDAMMKPVHTINSKLSEATKLVDDLLLSSRLESGSVESHPERVELGAIAASVAEQEKSRAELAGGRIEVEAPARPVFVEADPAHLVTIVGNLVRNGIAYSPGPPVIRIDVRREPSASIVVTDQGKGIPLEAQSHVFERFYRVQDRSGPPGTGLGLYISRQLARQLGGELELESSQVGQGSAFALRFPRPINDTSI